MGDHIGISIVSQHLKAAARIALSVEHVWPITFAVGEMCRRHQRPAVAVEIRDSDANRLITLLRVLLEGIFAIGGSHRGDDH